MSMPQSIPSFLIRECLPGDIPLLAHIRSLEWETETFWNTRIHAYATGTGNPTNALPDRKIYVAEMNGDIIGFIAGHLSTRLGCQGELQWINILDAYRGHGIASALIRTLATWFDHQHAYKICVDPGSERVRQFYRRNGARDLDSHWMYWPDIRKATLT